MSSEAEKAVAEAIAEPGDGDHAAHIDDKTFGHVLGQDYCRWLNL